MSKGLPKETERVRVRVVDNDGEHWIWADVTEVEDDTFDFSSAEWWGTRRLSEYGITWRFGEDDQEACAERPAVGDDDATEIGSVERKDSET